MRRTDLEIIGLEEKAVRWEEVSILDSGQVPHDEIGHRDILGLPVPDDGERLPCFYLLLERSELSFLGVVVDSRDLKVMVLGICLPVPGQPQ